nr:MULTISPECIES: hypothetical protein [Gordonia]
MRTFQCLDGFQQGVFWDRGQRQGRELGRRSFQQPREGGRVVREQHF